MREIVRDVQAAKGKGVHPVCAVVEVRLVSPVALVPFKKGLAAQRLGERTVKANCLARTRK